MKHGMLYILYRGRKFRYDPGKLINRLRNLFITVIKSWFIVVLHVLSHEPRPQKLSLVCFCHICISKKLKHVKYLILLKIQIKGFFLKAHIVECTLCYCIVEKEVRTKYICVDLVLLITFCVCFVSRNKIKTE